MTPFSVLNIVFNEYRMQKSLLGVYQVKDLETKILSIANIDS